MMRLKSGDALVFQLSELEKGLKQVIQQDIKFCFS